MEKSELSTYILNLPGIEVMSVTVYSARYDDAALDVTLQTDTCREVRSGGHFQSPSVGSPEC
jgi:hypothetical protein